MLMADFGNGTKSAILRLSIDGTLEIILISSRWDGARFRAA